MPQQELEHGLRRVEAIQDPRIGLVRVTLFVLILVGWDVKLARDTDHGVRIDKPGGYHRGRDHGNAVGNLRRLILARITNGSILNQDQPIMDRGPTHRMQSARADGQAAGHLRTIDDTRRGWSRNRLGSWHGRGGSWPRGWIR